MMNPMKWSILLLTLMIPFLNFAQSNGAEPDPKAKKILENLSKEYESYNTMEVIFDLIIDLPDQEREVQKGHVIQKGDRYKLDLDVQAIYSDGIFVWVYLKDNNEVQINDVETDDDEAGFLTPRDMMRIYESDDYYYEIVAVEKSLQGPLTVIEFKPTNPDSEYSKLRLSVLEKKKRTSSLEVFSKDGSRYILKVKDLITNKSYDNNTFVFDPKDFPGIRVEDLRL